MNGKLKPLIHRHLFTCHFSQDDDNTANKAETIKIKIKKMSSFKSNEIIYKKEDRSYYVASANKASSVTL